MVVVLSDCCLGLHYLVVFDLVYNLEKGLVGCRISHIGSGIGFIIGCLIDSLEDIVVVLFLRQNF